MEEKESNIQSSRKEVAVPRMPASRLPPHMCNQFQQGSLAAAGRARIKKGEDHQDPIEFACKRLSLSTHCNMSHASDDKN